MSQEIRCTFCGRAQSQVDRFVAGPSGVLICDQCVDLCKSMMSESAPGSGKVFAIGADRSSARAKQVPTAGTGAPATPDTRREPPYIADEREMLEAWLDYHRETLEFKCQGLTAEQLRLRSVPPSTLSLLGLIRHMADVERGWFRRTLAGEDAPPIYSVAGSHDDNDFEVVGASVAEAFAQWKDECARARTIAAGTPSLDSTGRHRTGLEMSLRWILVHMVEEYARHNGHADLLRETIDGVVGD